MIITIIVILAILGLVGFATEDRYEATATPEEEAEYYKTHPNIIRR